MKKRTYALLLALGLLLTTPALAAQDGNFSRVQTYHNQFSDLSADSVFYILSFMTMSPRCMSTVSPSERPTAPLA